MFPVQTKRIVFIKKERHKLGLAVEKVNGEMANFWTKSACQDEEAADRGLRLRVRV